MPIPFTCPHCGYQTMVAEQYAGQTGPCAKCGQPVTVPPLGGPAYYPPPPPKSSGLPAIAIVLIVLAVLFVCGGILAALLLQAVQAAREAARRVQCQNNLKQIALAMLNYEMANKSFPPAYIPDESGKPMTSWRTLILPYIEEQPLYEQYDFNKPWDDPVNQRVVNTPLAAFHCPSEAGPTSTDTSYVMVVGPGTLSDGPSAARIDEIRDGTSNTIMLVEIENSGIKWAEPKDITVDELIARCTGPGAKTAHPHVFNVAFCDGSVRAISTDIDPQVLRALLTRSGGESVDQSGF